MKLETTIMELMKIFDDYGDVEIVFRNGNVDIYDFSIYMDTDTNECVFQSNED